MMPTRWRKTKAANPVMPAVVRLVGKSPPVALDFDSQTRRWGRLTQHFHPFRGRDFLKPFDCGVLASALP